MKNNILFKSHKKYFSSYLTNKYLIKLEYNKTSNYLKVPIPSNNQLTSELYENLLIFCDENTKVSKLSNIMKNNKYDIELYDEEKNSIHDNLMLKDLLKRNFLLKVADEKKSIEIFNLAHLDSPQTNKQYFIESIKNKDKIGNTIKEIDDLLFKYDKMLKELHSEEHNIEKIVEKKRKMYINLIILYFLLHLLLFYALIYQIYGWDEIEPVTYLVGNLYWIFGIAFFLTFKSKIGLEFFFTNLLKNKLRNKVMKQIGYSSHNYKLMRKEYELLTKMKLDIQKF